MDLQLRSRHALISGSGGGSGEAIPRTLAAEGALVTVDGWRPTEVGCMTDLLTFARTGPDAANGMAASGRTGIA